MSAAIGGFIIGAVAGGALGVIAMAVLVTGKDGER